MDIDSSSMDDTNYYVSKNIILQGIYNTICKYLHHPKNIDHNKNDIINGVHYNSFTINSVLINNSSIEIMWPILYQGMDVRALVS